MANARRLLEQCFPGIHEIRRPSLAAADIRKLVGNRHLTVLQFSRPLHLRTYGLLNDEFFSRRPEVEFRVYGHYSDACDLRFARSMTNVRHFTANCLRTASHVESIAAMPRLRSLALGIWSLQSFDVLDALPPELEELSLEGTKSKQPRLRALSRFPSLRRLLVEGHAKDIEAIGSLRNLRNLTLRSISRPDLTYLKPLAKLKDLHVVLGGIRSFESLRGMASLQTLVLCWIRGLSDLAFVSTLTGLRFLELQNLPRVRALPSLRRLRALRQVRVQHLVGLRDFTELEWAAALEQFMLIDGREQSPEQLLPMLRNPALKRASAYFTSDRKNQRFLELLRQRNRTA